MATRPRAARQGLWVAAPGCVAVGQEAPAGLGREHRGHSGGSQRDPAPRLLGGARGACRGQPGGHTAARTPAARGARPGHPGEGRQGHRLLRHLSLCSGRPLACRGGLPWTVRLPGTSRRPARPGRAPGPGQRAPAPRGGLTFQGVSTHFSPLPLSSTFYCSSFLFNRTVFALGPSVFSVLTREYVY